MHEVKDQDEPLVDQGERMNRDFRAWIDEVQALGLLRTVSGADWDEEMGAITDINVKKNKYTLLFDKIKDYPEGFRLLTGALLDSKRVALSLGLSPTLSDLELVKILRERMHSANEMLEEYAPRYVEDAPLLENAPSKVDMLGFPAPKYFEGDGGRYIGTADAVMTRDPDTGWVNMGAYRMMVQDESTLSILFEAVRHARFIVKKYWDAGKPCPIAVSFGHHPLALMFAGIEAPQGVSELAYAGAISEQPYEVIKGPVTGLPIPADSELAIEGYVVNEPRPEGPFGELLGYYSIGTSIDSPIVKVEAVYHRNDPIMLGTCAGRPPHDYTYFRCPVRAALIWDILEKAGIQGVEGVWCHEVGYSRAFTVVSIKQMFAGHDRMAGHVACQCRPGAVSGRYVVVVDDDIDPTNLEDVVWAMCTRSDPATGIDIISGTVGTALDPIAENSPDDDLLEYVSNRGIIFATKPFRKVLRNEFPKVVESSRELKEKVEQEWSDIFSD
ncbi:UbiD family decarboxylase [Acidobacteria bacterium AH-259-D05]|nr:UbiD family decarboxylase [Acidobacteria bacterium AH-259-D05]